MAYYAAAADAKTDPCTGVRDAYYIVQSAEVILRYVAYERIRRVADEGTFLESDRDLVGENPLGFEGYEEKLAAERLKTE